MKPVFLYNDPHPVHDRMATAIDAEYVECSKGGALDRLRAGVSHRFEGRPILIEGGVPLLETGFMGIFGDSGPVIELAADATLIDLETTKDNRPTDVAETGDKYSTERLKQEISDYVNNE